MTNEELERAMAFLLESQAALSVKVDANSEAIARLTSISERHDAEIAAIRQEMVGMQTETLAVRQDMLGMQSEVRDAVNSILGVAESIAENVKSLTAVTLDTRRRVDALEEGRP